eukprot:13179-Heterococcus_DN1.PRE.3
MSTRSAQKTAASTRPRREAKPVQVVNIAAPDSPKRKKSSSKAGADTDANGKGKAANDAAAAAAKAGPAAKAKAGTPKVKSSEAAASAKAAQRKRPRNTSEAVDNAYTQIKAKMKSLISRLRQQMFRLEVYSQDASRSASSKKLAQHAEAATLDKRIRDTKLEVRELLKNLTEMNSDGARWDTLEPDEDGQIDLEYVLCTRCGTSETTDENDLVLCDNTGCFRAYHQECLDPPVSSDVFEEDEDSDWFCWQCECIADCLEMLDDEFEGCYFEKWQSVSVRLFVQSELCVICNPSGAFQYVTHSKVVFVSLIIDRCQQDVFTECLVEEDSSDKAADDEKDVVLDDTISDPEDDEYNPELLRAKAQAKKAAKAAAKSSGGGSGSSKSKSKTQTKKPTKKRSIDATEANSDSTSNSGSSSEGNSGSSTSDSSSSDSDSSDSD